MDPELLKRLMAEVQRANQLGLSSGDIDKYIYEETEGKLGGVADLFRASLTGQEPKPSRWSLLRPAAQGATFNFADELAGHDGGT